MHGEITGELMMLPEVGRCKLKGIEPCVEARRFTD
jgi:hypothetical protein